MTGDKLRCPLKVKGQGQISVHFYSTYRWTQLTYITFPVSYLCSTTHHYWRRKQMQENLRNLEIHKRPRQWGTGTISQDIAVALKSQQTGTDECLPARSCIKHEPQSVFSTVQRRR